MLSAAASARHDVSRSSGTLLDTEEAKMSGEPSDAKPPGYAVYEDAPPAFEEAHIFAHAKYASPEHDATGGSSNSSSGENKGLLNSLASPFKAATAALRTKPEPFVTALCQASAAGNVSQIRSLLAQGANINGRNDEGQTALICAVRAGRMDSVRILLESGADTSRADAGSKGRPPLYHAVDLANRSAAELLLKHSADANQKDSWGQRYFLALVAGDTAPEWIELLLSYGADALAKDISGQAAAVLALKRRKRKEDREEVVRLLLRHGAGTNTRDTDGTPLVHLCVQQERRGLALELLNLGADPSAKDASGISLLEVAVKNGDLELARAIVEKGADPNAKDFNGSHLLFTALGSNKSPGAGNMALAVMLLEHGARGGVKDFYGVTALEHALSPIIQGISAGSLPPPGGDKLNVPELLLKQGADPNQRLTKVSCEPTVLAYAVDRGLSDLAELVLRYRAAVNTVDKDGRTPLVRAVQRGDVDIVGMLLQHGANVNQPGPGLPLDVAVAMGNAEVADLLRSHGAEK